MSAPRRYYAIQHRYGANMRDADDGMMIGPVIAFTTAAARDTWVDNSRVHYRNERGYREALNTRKANHRRIVRYDIDHDELLTEQDITELDIGLWP